MGKKKTKRKSKTGSKKKQVKVNKKYKDRLFCLLFSDKTNILSLYNALNGSSYDNPDDVQVTTIDDVIYIHMKNDVSFLVDSCMSLWEQQSSYNPNMPVRGLMYFGNLYDAYIDNNSLNIYGTRLVKIPTPKYVVFYNGSANKPPVMELKLSDAFIQEDRSGSFEWTATMININDGKNPKLLKECRILSDYMTLIDLIRKYQKETSNIEKAVGAAISECIENNVLKQFLQKHRAEVLSVCIKEYNEKTFIKGIKEEGREEGRALEIVNAVEAAMKNFKVSLEDACAGLNYTLEQYNNAKKLILR